MKNSIRFSMIFYLVLIILVPLLQGEGKKPDVKFHLSYSGQDLSWSCDKNYRMFIESSPWDYWGIKYWNAEYQIYGDEGYLWSDWFPYEQDDILPLQRERTSHFSNFGRRIGFGMELRLFRDLWMVLDYHDQGRAVFSVEEAFEWIKIKEKELLEIGDPCNLYWLKLERTLSKRSTDIRFHPRYFRCYLKYNFDWKKFSFVPLMMGVGIWSVTAEAKQVNQEFGFLPWTGSLYRENPEREGPRELMRHKIFDFFTIGAAVEFHLTNRTSISFEFRRDCANGEKDIRFDVRDIFLLKEVPRRFEDIEFIEIKRAKINYFVVNLSIKI